MCNMLLKPVKKDVSFVDERRLDCKILLQLFQQIKSRLLNTCLVIVHSLLRHRYRSYI